MHEFTHHICNYCLLEQMKARWRKLHPKEELVVTLLSPTSEHSSWPESKNVLFNGVDQHVWFAQVPDQCEC